MGLFDNNKRKASHTNRATLQIHVKRELPEPILDENIFDRCPSCKNVLYTEDLEQNLHVCTHCGYHFRINARQRIALICDEGSFEELNGELIGANPLDFPGYEEKISKIRETTKETEAIITGYCTIKGQAAMIAVMNGDFMMGSMGAAVGEKFTLAAEQAIQKQLPLIAFTVSGGARMQEGLVSLMQMAKTSAVIAKMGQAKLPYFVVITDPTTGGVTASFAMLGDVIIAEPGALIGFAGRRVIEQTIKQSLPDDFQRTEFVSDKGFVDTIAPRQQLPELLARLIKIYMGGRS